MQRQALLLPILFLFSALLLGGTALNAYAEPADYPNINGGNWSGYYYIYDSTTHTRYNHHPLVASIYHDGAGKVTIHTSFEGWREYFDGYLTTGGDMVLWDRYDDEIWTTHFTEATSTQVHIADYVDTDYHELYIINLHRDNPDPLPVPTAPSLVSPEDLSSISVEQSPFNLEWQADEQADHYEVFIGADCSEGTVYQAPENIFEITDPEPGVQYYWQVRAVNADEIAGPWSSCWSFTTYEKHINLVPIYHLLLE